MGAGGVEPVYLDYAATTPVAPEVADMLGAVNAGGAVGNPSSLHIAGRRSARLIEDARNDVAALINAPPRDVLFTSGATESDNLAIRGAARYRAHRGRHIVTVATEHKAVLETARSLQDDGFDVTVLTPGSDGLLAIDALAEALRDDTQLVSVMHVNNETGVIQDIEAIGSLCRERGVLFHTDAAQSAGKLPLDVRTMPIDLLSMSAHKLYGPQGVGALYVARRPGCGVRPLTFGGSHEGGLRPGTEPVALIAAFGVAASLAAGRMDDDLRHAGRLCHGLWEQIRDLPLTRNGSADRHYPGILNVSTPGVEGESLMLALEPLCVASGSACNAQSGEASFVLKAMGLGDLEAQGAIRFSFGRYTSEADVDRAAGIYRRAVLRLLDIAEPAGAGA
jgi:cysteine desulfurase